MHLIHYVPKHYDFLFYFMIRPLKQGTGFGQGRGYKMDNFKERANRTKPHMLGGENTSKK